ncbi:hypothetical protein D3C74_49740 [compost metagenome]
MSIPSSALKLAQSYLVVKTEEIIPGQLRVGDEIILWAIEEGNVKVDVYDARKEKWDEMECPMTDLYGPSHKFRQTDTIVITVDEDVREDCSGVYQTDRL